MEEDKKEKDTDFQNKITEQVDKKIEEISKIGIQQSNVDYLYKLMDIKKDIAKIKCLEMEEDEMMYRGYDNYDNYGGYGNYGTYNGGRRRDSQGRYMEGGRDNYGRRYRGHEMIDDMADTYGEYMESRESGRYGSPESSKSFDYMLKSAEDFFKHLKNEAGSQEEVEKIKMTARKIANM